LNDLKEAVAMHINRRHFLFLTAGVATAGCQSVESGGPSVARPKTINAGPASHYAADGVYSRYRDVGFFIVRKGDKLFALSSYCTHRKCKLAAEANRSFYCPCHGSTFDPDGHVTKGPARVDLPVFSISSGDQGQLLVQLP
jgi:Rieske Fe-S protein